MSNVTYVYPTRPCKICDQVRELSNDRPLFETDLMLALRFESEKVEIAAFVVPRRHVRSLFELSPAELEDVARITKATAALVQNATPGGGISIAWDAGVIAGQSDPHLAVRVEPRRQGGAERHVPGANKGGR